MKEHGILMSAPMVKAILAGRKSVTRRIVKAGKLLPDSMQRSPSAGAWWSDPGGWIECPYGRVGDHLWVRETWKSENYSCWDEPQDDDHKCGDHCEQTYVYYRSTPRSGYRPKPDRAAITYLDESTPLDANRYLVSAPWRPSIFMPRWASRITLEVTDVRVERLQEISEEDANAEGCPEPAEDQNWSQCRRWYAALWDSINGKRAPWTSNPWVWRVAFRRVEPSQGGEGAGR